MTKKPITKAVLPIAGLGTRFLPLSKAFPKPLWPIGNRPMIDYVVREAIAAGAREIIFVISSEEKKPLLDYFKTSREIEKILKARGKKDILAELAREKKEWQNVRFSFVAQKKALGDGHAVLQALPKINKNEAIMVCYGDDIFDAKVPVLKQLLDVYQKYHAPVMAVKKVTLDKVNSYGIFKTKKISSRVHQIRDIIEKPTKEQAPSLLANDGRFILTPEYFDYLKKAKPVFRGEIILVDSFKKMIKDGKMVYGCEAEGRWLECGNVDSWLKTNVFLAKKYSNFKS